MREKIRLLRSRKLPPYTIPVLLVLLALLLEVFVFNYRFWQSRNYEPLEISPLIADDTVETDGDGLYTFTDNESGLYFSEFDVHVNNIYVDVESVLDYDTDAADRGERKTAEFYEETGKRVAIELMATDSSDYYGITMPERSIISDMERTKYIHLHLAGNTTYLRIRFTESSGDTIRVNHIILNAKVPFFFQIWRVLLVAGLFLVLYGLRPHSRVYAFRLNLKNRRQRLILAAVLLLQIAFSMGMTTLNTSMTTMTADNAEARSLEYQLRYVRLADALLDGHLDVDVHTGADMEAIEALENPYDPGLLSTIGVTWNDYAYYNGHYYVYFGVVPCLLFNIPYKLLTGNDLMPYPCIMILMPLFILSAFALIYALFRRYLLEQNRDISFVAYILLSLLFINGSAIGYLYTSQDAYFLPIFTALFFVTLGLTLWVSAVRREAGSYTISGWRLCCGSFCMALTGGCRPQFLIAMFLAIPLFWDVVFKEHLMLSLRSRSAVKHTLLFVIPIVAVACGLFWYNYARFGSIFDFGANYNQTNNDMTTRGFQPYRVLQGIFYYLLQPPNLQEAFPYLQNTTMTAAYFGTNILLETMGGVLWLQPAVLTIPLLRTVREECKTAGLYVFVWLLIAFSILVPCVDSVMAGIVDRYCLDFFWMMGLAAVLVLACMSVKFHGSSHEAALQRLLVWLTILTIYISVLMALAHHLVYNSALNVNNPSFFYGLKSMIEFWY